MTRYEKAQTYLLRQARIGNEKERQRKILIFVKILDAMSFPCIFDKSVNCDPELDCSNCYAGGTKNETSMP